MMFPYDTLPALLGDHPWLLAVPFVLGATLDLSALSEALKVFYLDSIKEQLNNASVLYSQLKKVTMYEADGKNFTFQLHTGRNKAAGLGLSEGGTFHTAGTQSYVSCIVPNRYLYIPIEVSNQAIYATKSEAGSAVMAVDSEIQGGVRDFKRAVNRQLNSDGTDALAYWTGADDTSGTNVDDNQGNAFVHLQTGATTCDLIDASDNSTELGSDIVVTLGAEAASNFAVTWTGTVSGSADGDYLVHANTMGKQLTGIQAIISTGDPITPTGGLQGLAVATYPWWKAQVVDGGTSFAVPGDITLANLQRPITRIATNSDYSVQDISFMVSNLFLQDKYADFAASIKRIVGTMELDAGWTGINFNGLAWIGDPQHQRQVINYICKDALCFVQTADLQWRDRGGAVLHPLETKDVYQAIAFCYMNLATTARNALGQLRYVAE